MAVQIRMLAGRRGQIIWKKPSFLGAGQRLDYDAYEAWGLFFPFVLTRPIHVFDIGQHSQTAPAILVRPDRGFVGRAYAQDWTGLLLFLLIFTTPVLPLVAVIHWMDGKSSWILLTVFAVLSAILLVASIIVLVSQKRADRRHQAIRLMLGTHAWGSSDPAFWHTDLLPLVVRPAQAFGVDSFSVLARKYSGAGDWCRATWAARLCCALEDLSLGETLTSEVLERPEASKILLRLRKNPEEREEVLGPPIPLSTWIAAEPREYVLTVTLKG